MLDLNVTSFCDIITVSIVALFMTMVIVVDMAMRTPKLRATPLSRDTTNMAVYVECRNSQLYFIDQFEITEAMQSGLQQIRIRSLASGGANAMETALSLDVGNEYYRVDNSFMMMGAAVLLPRQDVPGLQPPVPGGTGAYQRIVATLATNVHYLVFLVRDDSFDAFRKAREHGIQRGFMTGWEYLGRDEPITFDGMFRNIRAE
jgi:biopolymer transport protein ExbD